MSETEKNPNPHLDNPELGIAHGVPQGVTQEEAKGLPDSGRQATESAPLHKSLLVLFFRKELFAFPLRGTLL
jgi:hypothetical protein